MTAESPVLILTDSNYGRFLGRPNVVLMLGKSNGVSCIRFKPEFERLAVEFPHVTFGIAWVDQWLTLQVFLRQEKEITDLINGLPTTVFMKNSEVLSAMYGYYKFHEAKPRIADYF